MNKKNNQDNININTYVEGQQKKHKEFLKSLTPEQRNARLQCNKMLEEMQKWIEQKRQEGRNLRFLRRRIQMNSSVKTHIIKSERNGGPRL
jgi:acylphosphatase